MFKDIFHRYRSDRDHAGRGPLHGVFQFNLTESTPVRLAGPLQLSVTSGRAWVTVDGTHTDWFIGAGESFCSDGAEVVVVSGDPTCRIALHAAMPAREPLLHATLRRMQPAAAAAAQALDAIVTPTGNRRLRQSPVSASTSCAK